MTHSAQRFWQTAWGLSALLCGCVGASRVWAEAVGSPASVLKKGQWSMSASGGALQGRSLSGQGKATVYQGGHARGYGLTDWLSLYGKLGLARITVDDPTILKTNDSSSSNSFGANLFAAVQLKSRLWQHVPSQFEWDGSLQYIDMRASHKGKNEARWHEWQFATSVAKPFGRVKPYLGAKLSFVNMYYRVRQQGVLLKDGNYHQDSPFGVFVGSDFSLGASEDVVLNVETSYQGGLETNLAIQYVF